MMASDLRDSDIWRDGVVQFGLVSSVLLNVTLFAYLFIILGSLPAEVPLHFDSAGQVDRVGPPAALFVLAVIGLIAWILAAFGSWYFYHVRREEPVAYVVLGATMAIEVATWVAVFGLAA